MSKDLIIGCGWIQGRGTIKGERKDPTKLLASPDLNLDLNFQWGFWDDKEHKMKYGAKDFKDVNEFKEITIKICPGDIVVAEFIGYDGSVSTSCPLNSLSIGLTNPPKMKDAPKE